MNDLHDVIIVGAGAVGSYLAGELARKGHDVCVLERRAQSGGKTCCTGIVSAECLSLLKIPSDIIQFEARSARAFSPSGRFLRIERPQTQSYVLDRVALDRYLASRAEKAGALYRYGANAEDIRVTESQVELKISGFNGNPWVSARSLVVASGFPSSLSGIAGLGQISDQAWGAQTSVDCYELEEVEVYSGTNVAPGFFAWLVPTGDRKAKVGLLSRSNPRPHIERLLQQLAAEGKIKVTGHPVSYGAVPLKTLSGTSGRRLLVVGDAAGQVKPTTGGGIYFGILCARIAAATLSQALLQDDLSARRLAEYQRGWQKLLKKELSIDYWAHRFYRRLTDAQMEHIFSIIEQHGVHESILASPDITFDWHSQVILDVIRHRSLQKALAKLKSGLPPLR